MFEAQTDIDEARWIVEEVQALARDGIALRQIAVLYRSNAQSRVLEHALFSRGIPYRVYGGLRFFERQEIKHALAYLRLHRQPRRRQRASCASSTSRRAASARARIEQLQDAAQARGASLWQAASRRLAGKPGTLRSAHSRSSIDAR